MLKTDDELSKRVWDGVALLLLIIGGFAILNHISPWLVAIVIIALIAFAVRRWIVK